jgi:hypothetical protein
VNESPIAALVRGWVDLYTRGMPAGLRATRRAEVDDDLWCQHQEAAELGRSGPSLDAELALRLLFGMPADISWRLASHPSALSGLERSSTMGMRILGALAILAALSWGSLMFLDIPYGETLWRDGGAFVVLALIVGAIGFSSASLGLAWRYQDRVGPVGALGAGVVLLGAITSLVGSVVPLLVGSSMLMWDLARIGTVPRQVPIVHIATAVIVTIGYALGQLGSDELASRLLSVAVLTPYMLTWVAVGVQLRRGVPQAQATSG